jgi:hypothetical protein
VIATTVVLFPLGLAGLVPRGVILGGVLLVTLGYLAVADFLYMGRLAAYVAIVEFPPMVLPKPTLSIPPQTRVDPDELILSDVPTPS